MNDFEDDKRDDDLSLWAYVTKTVQPLKEAAEVIVDHKGKDQDKKKDRNHNVANKGEVSGRGKGDSRHTRRVIEPVCEIERSIDRRTQEKLRRGQMRIEASLDLHGMNRLQAHEALENFIVRAHRAGMRTVLVITGKGVENKGILRQEVPRWLYEGVLAPLVLQHYFSKGHHGGDGALYVLLRRVR